MPIPTASSPTYTADVTGVFDQNFNQVFEGARPMKVNVNEHSQLMKQPVETGATFIDHTVELPNEIELSVVLRSDDFRSTYEIIRQLYKSKTLLIVQTKTASYSNMLIQSMPHDEDPALFDTIAMAIKMEEAQFYTAVFAALPPKKVKKKTNATTQALGEKQPKSVSQTGAADLADKFTGLLKRIF